MINLSDSAKKCLDGYLQQVRTYLRGCKTVDADEIEHNVIEHIESEFESATAAVSFEELDIVLQRLGSPRQWIPEEEISWWRKIIFKLRTGPEDWRLAYISFGLLIAGFIILPSFIVLIPASFIVARAALSETADPNELKSQKWLIYPVLIIVYVAVTLLILFWFPTIILGCVGLLDDFYEGRIGDLHPEFELQIILVLLSLAGVALGLWFIVLGSILTAWPRIPRKVFRPFADGFKRKYAVVMLVVGVILTALCGFLALISHTRIPTQIIMPPTVL
jgi:hypothetical protein